jgi:hypothetical protein
MTTVGDQIYSALRLIGQLAEGETPSTSTSQDALLAFNQMVDSWNTERLSVYCTLDQVFSWPAGEITRTLGPSGDFIGQRPVSLLDSTFYKTTGQGSFACTPLMINEDQYNAISVKNTSSTLPQVIWVNNTFPDITIKAYPEPSQVLEWHFISVQPLPQYSDLTTVLYFPPGYMEAFYFNLAVKLAPQFGVEASATVKETAKYSKLTLMRINSPHDVMSMPLALVSRNQRYNILTGNY